MKKIATILGVLFAFAFVTAPAIAQAPQPYPNRVVKLIIGFPAGQATDILGRQLAERMSAAFGQPVIVENRPGQSGSMALDTLARSAPDGYTMILAASGGLGLWIGMLFPKGTPADIVSKVSTQLNKDLTDPELVRKFVELGAVPHPSSPKDFAQFIKAEYVRVGKLVQESGAKAD